MNSTITLNGIDYIPATEAGPRPPTNKQILVLQRGWIYIGDVAQIGDEFVITDAQVIRVWGTTRGLGQLALDGPTDKTKLDPAGTVRAHVLTVVLRMDVEESKWK